MNTDTYYLNASELSSAISSYDNYLTQVSDENRDVRASLNDFSSSSVSVLVGDVWDGVRNNLEKYDQFLEVSEAINAEMIATNKECLEIIQNFLEPDSDLNTADLPKFEAQRDQLKTDIQTLKDEITVAESVSPTRTEQVGTNEDGTPIYGQVPNEPDYTNAQNTIRNNTQKITELTAELNETIRLIDKINQFMNEILPSVTKKLEEMEQYLQVFMDQVDALILSGSYSPRTGGTQRTYDLNTQDGRMFYIYDQLTEKYGYSEWGAKAIIAQMYGTNSKFLPDRFQSDLPANAGYGLCQWEYKKYGGTVDDAQMMEDWCKQNGYDYRTIDGQLAWLDHYIPIKANGYHDSEFVNELKTATQEDYYKMVSKFGTYHQGTQGDQNKNYNRAYNGEVLYGLFPKIDQHDSSSSGTTSGTTSSNSVLSDLISSLHANSPRTTGDTETTSGGSAASTVAVAATAATPAVAAAYSAGSSSTGADSSGSGYSGIPISTDGTPFQQTTTGGSAGVPISTDGTPFQQTESSTSVSSSSSTSETSGIPISADGSTFQSINDSASSPKTGNNNTSTNTTQTSTQSVKTETSVSSSIGSTTRTEVKTNTNLTPKVDTTEENTKTSVKSKIEEGYKKAVTYNSPLDNTDKDETSFASLMESVNNDEVIEDTPVTNNTTGKTGVIYNANSTETPTSVSEPENAVTDESTKEIKINDVELTTSVVDEISREMGEEKPIEINDVKFDDGEVATEGKTVKRDDIAKGVLTGVGLTSSLSGLTGAAIYENKHSKEREEEDEDEIKVQGEDEIENLI